MGDIGNVSSNAFVAQSTKQPIEGMSNDSYNLALMYAKHNIDAHLAWVENFDHLDGLIFYTIFEHCNLGVQVQSTLDSKTDLDDDFSSCHPRGI